MLKKTGEIVEVVAWHGLVEVPKGFWGTSHWTWYHRDDTEAIFPKSCRTACCWELGAERGLKDAEAEGRSGNCLGGLQSVRLAPCGDFRVWAFTFLPFQQQRLAACALKLPICGNSLPSYMTK